MKGGRRTGKGGDGQAGRQGGREQGRVARQSQASAQH